MNELHRRRDRFTVAPRIRCANSPGGKRRRRHRATNRRLFHATSAVSTVARIAAAAFAAAMTALVVVPSWGDEKPQPAAGASGSDVSGTDELEQANARGRLSAAHVGIRAKAWAHIRSREYDAAIAVLHELQATEIPEDAAFTHQALAAAFNFKRDYGQVLHHQMQIVEQPGNLPAESVRAALMSAGYLSFQQRRFEDAVRYMETWKEGEETLPARFFAMLARAYSELGDRPKSVLNAKAALEAAEAEGVVVPEWVEQLAH